MSDTLPRLRVFVSRIWIRLLAFNVLLVFLPLAAVFYLDAYEQRLLRAQERAMVQQGRLVAAALGGGRPIDAAAARELLARLGGRTSARLRILDADAHLLADTSIPGQPAEAEATAPSEIGRVPQESWLYRLGALPFRLRSRLQPPVRRPEENYYAPDRPFDGSEVAAALAGRYGATTRISGGGQRSVTLYSAIPIRDTNGVVGISLVSQSTFQILQDLYEVRLAIFKVILASLAAACVLSLMVSTTIARPLRRLRRETAALLDARGRLRGKFEDSRRYDEIGDLNRALRELARRLREHQEFTDSFAADLSHEFKNPLAAIRSATEVIAELDDPADRARFIAMIQQDTARLEHLLSTLRELTTIDAGRDDEQIEPLPLEELCRGLVEGWQTRHGDGVRVEVRTNGDAVRVHASPHRLSQIVDNLLDNASSFSPPGALIEVEVDGDGAEARLRVRDHGPGIPEQHRQQVFHRFFSYRPEKQRGEHAGLGLAIVKAIAESYGGSVSATDAEGGGAVVEVRLPRKS